MKKEINHLKEDNPWNPNAVCGQAGNPWVVWGPLRPKVSCKKCLRIMRARKRNARRG